MAAWYSGQSLAILNFLLDGAWDLENVGNLQFCIWRGFWDRQIMKPGFLVRSVRDLEPWLQVSRRAYDLGHEFGEGPKCLRHSITGYSNSVTGYLRHASFPETMEPEAVRTLVHFFVSHGADIEQVHGHCEETALLSVAHSGRESSLLWLCALLEHGADYTVQDRYGRGPLHLTLKKNSFAYEEGEGIPATSMRLMEAKLVCLIRAGCSIHEDDSWGLTPTDIARGSCLRFVWENALREVNMLDDEMFELLDEKVRQYYPLGPSGTDNKFLSAESISLCGTNQLQSQSNLYSTDILTKITIMALKIFGTGLSMTTAKIETMMRARKKAGMKAKKNARMSPRRRTRQSKSKWKRNPKKCSTPTP